MNRGKYFVIIIILLSTNLFAFDYASTALLNVLNILTILYLIFRVFTTRNKTAPISSEYDTSINLIIVLVLISSIPAFFFHKQSFDLSLYVSRPIFYWLLYKYLHKRKIRPEMLENILYSFGVIWSLIVIFQQFTYPNVMFNEVNISSDDFLDYFAETRGVIRVNVPGMFLSFLAALLSVNRLLVKVKYKYIFVLVICILGIFYTGARQSIATLLLCICLMVLFARDKATRRRVYPVFLLLTVLAFIVIFKYDYLIRLIGTASDDLSGNDTYIRLYEAQYLLFDYWPHWLTYILGNGRGYSGSAYGKELLTLIKNRHIYRADVGIIGALNEFGFIYVIIVLRFFYKAIFKRKLPYEKAYIKYFFICVFILSWAAQDWFAYQSSVPILAIVLYLGERYALKNKTIPGKDNLSVSNRLSVI